jgi:WD40 repeat protein
MSAATLLRPGPYGLAPGESRAFDGRRLPTGVRFLPGDGRLAFRTCGRSVEVWDARTGKQEGRLGEGGGIGPWAVSPVCGRTIMGSANGEIVVCDPEGQVERTLSIPEAALRYLSDEPSGLARSSYRSNPLMPEVLCEDFHPRAAYREVCDVAVSPDGTKVVAAYGQAYALVWCLRTGALLALVGREVPGMRAPGIYRARWHPRGDAILTADDLGTAVLRRIDTGAVHSRVRFRVPPAPMMDGVPLRGLTTPFALAGIGAIGITPDGSRIVVSDREVLRVWEIASRRWVAEWRGHSVHHPLFGWRTELPSIHDLRFSQDGSRALTVGEDTSLRVWDVTTGRQIWSVTPDPCCIDHADLAPDGRHVAWAGCPGARLYAID